MILGRCVVRINPIQNDWGFWHRDTCFLEKKRKGIEIPINVNES